MAEGKDKYNNQGECISMEELLLYSKGNSDPASQHRIEKHLLECELCSDALEGIELMRSESSFQKAVSDINSGIDRMLDSNNPSTAEPGRLKVIFPWKIAAAFALLAVSMLTLWIFIPKTDEQALFKSEFEPYREQSPVDTSSGILSPEAENYSLSPQEEVIKNSDKKSAAVRPKESTTSKDESTSNAANISQTGVTVAESDARNYSQDEAVSLMEVPDAAIPEDAVSPLAKTEKKAVADKDISMSETEAENKEEQVRTITSEATAARPAAINRSVAVPDNFSIGMEFYNSNRFREAIAFFEKEQNRPEARFYSGVCYLSENNPHLAIKRLESYLKSNHKGLREPALWYKALAEIKTEDIKSAKKSLEQVVEMKGEHADKASALLRKL